MFKVGDKIRCVVADGVLVEGETYIVNDTASVTIQLKGARNWWRTNRFTLVENRGQAGGLKFDQGKAQWGLLLSGKGMLAGLLGVVKVLMFGAKKYAAHSWREVEDNERRYLDGLFRHYAAIMEHGLQAKDEESGELHIDHLNCNGLFLAEIARKVS